MKITKREWFAPVALLILVFALTSVTMICVMYSNNSKEVSRESIGRIIDVNLMPVSFNQHVKTQVKTERHYVVVYSTISCPLGVEAYIIRYENGRTYFTWAGAGRQYLSSN